MSANIKVSVIIPIHNSEKYLEKCLDSVLNQTLDEIEIIAVENGSIDNSKKILQNYKNQIKIFSLSSASISNARNKGIKESNGEYILFFDSDDFMDKYMCEKLYFKAVKEHLDLVTTDYYKYYENDNKIEIFETYKFDICNIKENKDLLWKINYGPIKLFKRNIIFENNIFFPKNIKYEDTLFVFEFLINSNIIGKVNQPLFTYVIHNNSETITRDEKMFDIFKSLDIINNKLVDKEYEEALTNLNTKIITNYTIQQRYQKDKKLRNKFINQAFYYLNEKFSSWKKCKYLKERNKIKKVIESNRVIAKIYCSIYNISHKLTK